MTRMVLAAVLLAVGAMPAQAAIVTVDFSGHLVEFEPSPNPDFSFGDTFLFRVKIDTDVAQIDFTSRPLDFADTYGSKNVTTVTPSAAGGMRTTFFSSGKAMAVVPDEFRRTFVDHRIAGGGYSDGAYSSIIAGGMLSEGFMAAFVWTYPTAFYFNADIQSPFEFDNPDLGHFDVVHSTGSYLYAIDHVSSTTAVPEPSSWAMVIGGLGLVGASMRCRKTTLSFG